MSTKIMIWVENDKNQGLVLQTEVETKWHVIQPDTDLEDFKPVRFKEICLEWANGCVFRHVAKGPFLSITEEDGKIKRAIKW